MTGPTSAMSAELYQTIGSQVASVAPSGWTEIVVNYAQVGWILHVSAVSGLASGERAPVQEVPMGALMALADLRDASYQPGAGTWFEARVVVRADHTITAEFNYDRRPQAEFDTSAYAADLEKFPRSPAATPAWLADALAAPPTWYGMRWQIDLTPGGAPRPEPIDGTTTDEARAWSREILQRLMSAGLHVTPETDEGEDGAGNVTVYDQLTLDIGTGYMALSFFRDLIFWTTEVFAHDCDAATFESVARTVLAAVAGVSGYVPEPDHLSTDEKRLLGLE
ncbi:hypothetical protein [Actinotalea subterranea]|uniref:hypothetical protein n=1 Tax=Actinotalea subterranea TaxID=2607497 RepID=UPI0011EE8D26|nr:hypothetical protein [Actinotalea subterranea]